jgi:iron-sulfur cluster assembly protein
MTTESTQPTTKKLMVLTDSAIKHVKSLLERQNIPDHYLRIGVAGGGCSGLSYKLGTEAQPGPGDKVLEFEGLKVLIDIKSSLYLAGMELDYSDDLMNAGFIFKNPNAKSSCGCGTSFSA